MAQLKSTKVFGDLNVTGEVNASTKITVNGKEVWDTGNLLNIGTTAATARTALGLGAQATRWPTFAEVTGKPSTYAPSGHTHPHTQVTGLGTAATRNVGTGSGQVMEVGAFGLGSFINIGNSDLNSLTGTGFYKQTSAAAGTTAKNYPTSSCAGTLIVYTASIGSSSAGLHQIFHRYSTAGESYRRWSDGAGSWSPWVMFYHTGNMPTTATRWPTFAEVTGKPTNYATTWGSVASKPATATRWPTWSEVTGKPSLAPNSSSNATNGWWKCGTSGLIIQWGRGAMPVVFPIKFPSACIHVSITPNHNRSNTMYDGELSATGITATGFTTFSGLSYSRAWIAFGY